MAKAASQTSKVKRPQRKADAMPTRRINPNVLMRAGQRPPQPNPFQVATHPPAFSPNGTGGKLAMDEATSETLGWAMNAVQSQFLEGQAFLGYPYLSILAQRPEYRRVSEVIATELTRKWIKLKASGDEDKSDKIKQLEDACLKLRVRDHFRRVAEIDGFFGRAHLFIDIIGSEDDRAELMKPIGNGLGEVSALKIKKGSLKAFRAIEPLWVYPTDYNSSDPLRADWYNPQSWFVQGKQIHSSRLLTFVGREVPDILKPAYSFGGLSMSQMVKPYVDNWLRTRQSVNDLILNFSCNALKTDLATIMMGQGGDDLFDRIDTFNKLRNNRGVLVLDKNSEEFDNVSAPLGTLDKLQAQALEHICSVSGIPLVKYTGITPSGLNASSDGEIRVFYDWILAYQEHFFTKHLKTVLGFIQISEFGEVDPDITFDYEPLWSLDEKTEAEMRKIEAETDVVLIDGGVLHPEEARQRIADDPDTPYAGLDVSDVPEPPMEQPGQEDFGPDDEGSQPDKPPKPAKAPTVS